MAFRGGPLHAHVTGRRPVLHAQLRQTRRSPARFLVPAPPGTGECGRGSPKSGRREEQVETRSGVHKGGVGRAGRGLRTFPRVLLPLSRDCSSHTPRDPAFVNEAAGLSGGWGWGAGREALGDNPLPDTCLCVASFSPAPPHPRSSG